MESVFIVIDRLKNNRVGRPKGSKNKWKVKKYPFENGNYMKGKVFSKSRVEQELKGNY